MKTLQRVFVATLSTSVAFAGWLIACDDTPTAAVYVDASTDTGTVTLFDAESDAEGSDAASDASAVVEFTVPTGGGSASVTTSAGTLSFGFPASAAGKKLTLAPVTAAAAGLTAAQALAVVSMEPEGERFADPIVLKLSNTSTGPLYTMPNGATKLPGSTIAYNKAVSGYLVYHFSRLVIAPSGDMCDAPLVVDTPDAGRCTTGSASTQRTVTCPSTPACIATSVSCCFDPSTDAGTGCPTTPFASTLAPTESTHSGREPQCAVTTAKSDGGTCQGSFVYNYAEANGCEVSLSCNESTFYLKCDGTTCTCQIGQSAGKSFEQGNACDNVATMKKTYVEGCAYPSTL